MTDHSAASKIIDRRVPTLREAVPTWTRIALLSFGGPAGQIAVMHRILVDEKHWIGERRFLHALNYCMLLPGPEAQQLATYIGWLMHRTAGGLIAGVLFVLPGFVSIMALSIVYALYGDVGPVGGLFFGLKAAVLVIVVQAVIRVGKRSLRSRALVGLAAAAFVALFFFRTPFPLVILASGLVGLTGSLAGWSAFKGGGHGSVAADALADAESLLGEETPAHCRPNLRWSLSICGLLAVLWLAPVTVCGLLLGWDNVFSQIGVFFSKMAVVTFGGAYAVLSYVAQEAVQTYGWLRPGEMLDGLGMAETTPGPLIIVTQFVGFLAAMRKASGLDPLLAGVLGGMLTTWVTFVPCFLWIFFGAPFVEMLRGARVINAALAAISAAVVGVILNLAVWLGLHDLFKQMRPAQFGVIAVDIPVLSSLSVASAVLTVGAAIAAFRFKIGLLPLLAGCAVLGVAIRAVE